MPALLTKTHAASVFDLDDLDALKVERDENDQRKEPTISEKVALAEAIAERLGQRVGTNQHVAKGGEIFPEAQGRNKDIAAAKAGLGSGKTLEAAQKVIERGIPELVIDKSCGQQVLTEPAGVGHDDCALETNGAGRRNPEMLRPRRPRTVAVFCWRMVSLNGGPCGAAARLAGP